MISLIEYPPDYDLDLWLTRYFEFRDRLAAPLSYPVNMVITGEVNKGHFVEESAKSRRTLYVG